MDLQSIFNAQSAELIELRKGEVVFHQGDISDSIYSIQSGLLKAYYVTEDGREFIKSFIAEKDAIGNLSALVSAAACTFSLICLEPTKLIRLPFKVLVAQAEQDLNAANAIIQLLIKLAIKKERREHEFLCLSAEERYQLLLEHSPELLIRVTQNDIARYLGITPVGLSRICTRIQGH